MSQMIINAVLNMFSSGTECSNKYVFNEDANCNKCCIKYVLIMDWIQY